ncbi:MAG: sigma-54-dependent Fis family transcriptional regulator [Planctomycetota bacterium]
MAATRVRHPLKADEVLSRIAEGLGGGLEPPVAMSQALGLVCSLLQCDAASVFLLDDKEHGTIHGRTATGPKARDVVRAALAAGEGIAGWVASNGRPLLVGDVRRDPEFQSKAAQEPDLDARSIACAPLRLETEVVGAVEAINPVGGSPFTEEDLATLALVARLVGARIADARAHAAVADEVRLARTKSELAGTIVGVSEPIAKLVEGIARAARTDAPILVVGEQGSGKELVARTVHARGARKDGPFVEVDCATLPEGLAESEVFGHEKGAFPDATAQRKGKIEAAAGGTLYLSNVESLPEKQQGKLLKALVERTFTRMGGTASVAAEARVIAGTRKDLLHHYVQKGTFRRELFLRLHETQLAIPPIRKRREDVPILIQRFIEEFNEELKKSVKKVSDVTMNFLAEYHWPGNVRELRNVIKRAMIVVEGPVLFLEHLPVEVRFKTEVPGSGRDTETGRVLTLEEIEKHHIQEALEHHKWNKTRTAEALQISRPTLDKKIQVYGLRPQTENR